MPDIKLKPTMDKPKMLEINRGPKDAGSILKEQYQAQQTQRQPVDKNPVQYATDKVETTARRGTELTADGVRRGAKRHKEAAKQRKPQTQEQSAHKNGSAGEAANPPQAQRALTQNDRNTLISRRNTDRRNRHSGALSVNINRRLLRTAGRGLIPPMAETVCGRKIQIALNRPPHGSVGGKKLSEMRSKPA